MSEPTLIGLCGRSGAGKSYVCARFAALGIPAVDTDAVYRTMTAPAPVLSPCMAEIAAAFGESIVLPDHSLDRAAVRRIVFSPGGESARQRLNRITHTHILKETMRMAHRYTEEGYPLVIIDAPLLFESGFDRMCRFTICVTASEETSVERIMRRDNLTSEAARARLATQLPEKELVRRCNYRIVNEPDNDTLDEQIASVAASIRAACGIR